MTRQADLAGCIARIEWAEHAVRELNGLALERATMDDDEPVDDGSLLVRAALLASNVVHQLRSTLDNLVWQLVILNGEEPDSRNAFPIFAVHNSKSRSEMAKKVRGTHKKHAALIEECQPY
jgi:hypothetical protein